MESTVQRQFNEEMNAIIKAWTASDPKRCILSMPLEGHDPNLSIAENSQKVSSHTPWHKKIIEKAKPYPNLNPN